MVALGFGCTKKEARLLRYAFSTEGVQRYRTTLVMSSSDGAETRIVLEESHRVPQVSPDGNAWVEVRFDTAEVHLSDPQSLAAAFLARSLQGKLLHINVSAKGEIGSIEDSSQGSPAGIDLGQTFSQVFPPLPATPIRSGDSWTTDRIVPLPSPRMEITNHVATKYTLVEFEKQAGKDIAKVRVKTQAELSGKSKESGVQGKLQGKMTGEGFILFSLEDGRLLSLEMRNETEVSSQNEGGKVNKTTTQQVVKVEALR